MAPKSKSSPSPKENQVDIQSEKVGPQLPDMSLEQAESIVAALKAKKMADMLAANSDKIAELELTVENKQQELMIAQKELLLLQAACGIAPTTPAKNTTKAAAAVSYSYVKQPEKSITGHKLNILNIIEKAGTITRDDLKAATADFKSTSANFAPLLSFYLNELKNAGCIVANT